MKSSTPNKPSNKKGRAKLAQQIDTVFEERLTLDGDDKLLDSKGIVSRYLKLAQQHSRLLVVFMVIALGWALAYHLFAYTPSFMSEAKVIIKDSAINRRYVEEEQYYALQTTSSHNASPVLNTMQLIYSRMVSQQFYSYLKKYHPEVLDSYDIHSAADWQEFFKDGSDFIMAKNIPGTDIIVMNFNWSDPVIAKEGLGQIIKGFQNASRNVNQAEEIQRSKFIQAQMDDLTQKLVALRGEKSQFQSNTLALDAGIEGNDLASNRLSLKIRLNTLQADLQGKIAEKNRYEKLLGLSSSEAFVAAAVGTNSHLTDQKQKLYNLQQEYARLNSFYTEKSPQVKEVKSQMDQIKANIEQELKQSLGKKYRPGMIDKILITDSSRASLMQQMIRAEADIARMQEESSVIRKGLGEVETRIHAIPGISKNLTELQEKEQTLSNALNALREKQIEATLRQSQTLSNIFVADPPTTPTKAEFPRPIHFYPLALIAAFLLWFGYLVLQEQFLASLLPQSKTPGARPTQGKSTKRIFASKGLVSNALSGRLFQTLKQNKHLFL